MKRSRQSLISVLLYTSLLLSLYLMMVLMATLPNQAIRKNMQRSAMAYGNSDRYAFTQDGSFQNVTDNYADLMWLNISWQMGTGDPFLSTLDTGYYDGEKYGEAAGLFLTVTKDIPANTSYTRYWHGTAALLRVLHLFTDVRGIKTLGLVCLILLILKTLLALVRSGHGDLALCLAASLYLIQFWNLRLSLEYLPCFLICFGLCPVFLRLEKKGDFPLELLSMAAGTLTAFFDFLTTETVTLLLPLLLVVAVRSRERRLGSPRRVWKLLLRCGLHWLLAYGATFLLKWTAVSLATGANHFALALDSAAERFGGAVAAGQVMKKPGMFMAVTANLSALFRGTSRNAYRQVIIYLLLILGLVRFLLQQLKTRTTPRPGTAFLLALGCVVLLRYGLLANHAYKHAFFTYRALISTIFAVLSAIVLNLRSPEGGRKKWN